MSTGTIELEITDLTGAPIQGALRVEFDPVANTGGARMTVAIDVPGATHFTVSNLPCRPGPGTLYRASLITANYRQYSFFQTIYGGQTAPSPDNGIQLAVQPSRVKGIAAPPLAPALAAILPTPALFDAVSDLQKACLLNIYAKASHPSSAGTFRFVRNLLQLEQDRVFCTVAPELEAFLIASPRFKSAPNTLHKPLRGFQLHNSFKSRDAHANIQFTLLRETATGLLAADIDIDEYSGIEHGFEVLRNQLTGGKTNPYQVHQLLLLTELDPGYQLLLR